MENEKIPEINQKNQIEKLNPNNIGSDFISFGKGVETSPDKVYRIVHTEEAIDDIEKSGVVRNRQSAGLVEKNRWGEQVFWSKGVENKRHPVSQGSFLIEAPLSVAEERIVTKEDISAIYTNNEEGEIFNILKQKQEELAKQEQEMMTKIEAEDAQKLAEIRSRLNI